MSGTELKVGVKVEDGGSAKNVVKDVRELGVVVDKVVASVDSLADKLLKMTAPKAGLRTSKDIAGSIGDDVAEYGMAKGISGATGASGRDFSKQAKGLGGLVHIYATFAANLFAVSAAFTALKHAADTDNMIKGLDQLGARSGLALGTLSKKLVEATDGAISLRDAMTATAQASAAGMSSESIERLAKVARNAGNALGIDASEALSRLSRGVSKLEPELLDELGIFIRIDDVVSDYARSVGKASTAITDFEKRQAVAQAVLKQGEDKFGNLQIDANPYQKLLSTIENVAHGILSIVNTILGPVAKYLAESPNVVLGVLTMLTGYLLQKAVPAIAEYSNAVTEAASKELKANKATADAVSANFKAKQRQLIDSKALYESIETDIEKIIDRTSAAEMKALSARGSRGSKAVKDIMQNAPTYSAADIPPEKLAIIDALAAKNTKMALVYKELAAGIREYQAAETASIQASKDRAVASELLAKAERDLAEAKSNLVKINTALALSEAKQKASAAGGLIGGFSTLLSELGKVDASKFDKVKVGISGGLSLIGSSLSKALNFVNPWIIGITTAIAVWDIADGVFSKNAKELTKLNSSIEGLDDSLKATSKTIDTYANMDISKALPLDRVKAMSAALNDLSAATSKVVADFKDMVTQSNLWDKSKQAVLSIFGLDKQTEVAKKVSSSLAKALALADEGPAKEVFKKKLTDITGSNVLSEEGLAISLSSKSTEEFTSSIGRLSEAEIELNKQQSASTAKVVELSEAFKTTERAFDTFAQSLQSNNPLAAFANTLVQQSMKIASSLEEPIEALDNLVELGSKSKQLALISPGTVAELKTAMPVIERINKDLKEAKQELTKKQEERSLAKNPEDVRFLDQRIATLKGEVDKLGKQAEAQTLYFLTRIQQDGFRVAADVLSKEIVQATKQAGLELAKARLPLLTNERLAEEQGKLTEAQIQSSITLAETNRDLIRAHYLSIAELKENTAQLILSSAKSTEKEREQATKDITTAKIQQGMLQSDNPIAAYQQLTSEGMSKEVKASANAIFQQVQNLSSFTKTIIELRGQLAAAVETTKINKALGTVKDANEILTATNKTKQAELDRLQTISQIVGFSTLEQLAVQKQLEDEIAINQQKIQTSEIETRNRLLNPNSAVEAKEIAVNNKRLADIRKQASDDQNKRDMNYAKKNAESILFLAKLQAEADADRLETQASQLRNVQELLDTQLQAAQQLGQLDDKAKSSLEYQYGLSKAKNDFEYQQGKLKIEQEQKFAEFDARRAQIAMAPGVDLATKLLQLQEVNKLENDYIALQGAKVSRDRESYELLLKKLGVNKDTTLELAKQKEAMDSLTRITDSLATIFGSVGKAIGETVTELYKTNKAQKDLNAQKANALKAAKSETEIKEINAEYTAKSQKEEIGGYARIAGAAKGMFKEKTFAFKAFAAIERAMHIARLAMDIKEMFSDTAKTGTSIANSMARAGAAGLEAIVKAYTLPPPLGFVTGAAMTVIIAGLLGSIFGGKTARPPAGFSAEEQQKVQGTGQVYDSSGALVQRTGGVTGDVKAVADSVKSSIDLLNKEFFGMLGSSSSNIVKALNSIKENTGDTVKALLGKTLGTSASPFGTIESTSKVLGGLWGKTTTTIADAGIKIIGNVMDLAAKRGTMQQYENVVTTKSSWFGFSKSTRATTNVAALEDRAIESISRIFKSVGDVLVESATALEGTGTRVTEMLQNIPIDIKVSTKGMTGQEAADAIMGEISVQLNRAALQAFPYIEQFNKIGEEMYETVARIVKDGEVVNQGLKMIGKSIGNFVGEQAVVIQQDIITRFGSLDKFVSKTQFYFDNFMTATERYNVSFRNLQDGFRQANMTMPRTKQEYTALVNSLDLTTETGRASYATLISLSEDYFNVLDAQSAAQKDQIDALNSTITSFKDFAKNVKTFRDSLVLSASSLATPFERYTEAKRQFESTYTAALGGDKDAMGRLTTASQTFLDASKSMYASSDTYATDYSTVLQRLTDAGVSAEASADVAQLQLDAMNSSIGYLASIDTNIASLAGGTTAAVTAHAAGGMASGWSLVGEKGAELVDFNTPGRVYTADQTAGMFAGGPGMSQSINAMVVEIQSLREEVTQLRKDQQKQTGDLIISNYDANQKAAEEVANAVTTASADSTWTERSKSQIK